VRSDPHARFSFPRDARVGILSAVADYYQTIIDTQARPDDADHLARHVVSFLSGKGVIAASPSQEGGYARGPHAMEISESVQAGPAHETIPPVHSHLQVMIGRATHSADMSDPRLPVAHCPECGWKMVDGWEDRWSAAVQEWLTGDDEAFLDCARCQIGAPVAQWKFVDFGFGSLAFRFWNWPPFRPAFLEELGKELGHAVSLVRGKL
jgi:hypothetical protein